MTDTMKPPLSPEDPRPDNKPFYIEPNCKCGAALVLDDSWEFERDYAIFIGDQDTEWISPWHDEWVCPVCRDGIHMDWPQEATDDLRGMVREASVMIEMDKIDGGKRMSSWDDFKKEIGLKDPTPEERAEWDREYERKERFYDEWLAKRGRARPVLTHDDAEVPSELSEADIKASRKMS